MDAPSHFLGDGISVDAINLEVLTGSCALLNFSHKGAGATITAEDIQEYEQLITGCRRVLLRTDWERSHDNQVYFENFPVLSVEAAHLLASYNICLLGMDTPSPGPLDATGREIHHILLTKNVVIVESLQGLSSINRTCFTFIALPLPIKGCSGSPCRAIAMVDI